MGAVGEHTSVNFIGADAAYAQNIHGEGMRVGVIDTGIDYTHKMLLGEGTAEAFKAVVPSVANAGFPNKKVVGGIDLVGTDYDSASAIFAKHIPTPDVNPIDEAGHGTHVAGTIAGIGDGVNTYSGVAPAAELYAIKVFGAKGSTNDEIVIAALEYAADPTGDLSFTQQLDVVNLSLGSGFGNPHLMYAHAVRNLVRGGTVVVASAGNSGDKSYIVGSPSTSDEAISVASSIDNQTQNIQFPTVVFQLGAEALKAEIVEASITKELSRIPELKGEVIAVGLADADFDATQAAQIAGKVALIDRGKVTFTEKIGRAQKAGAIAVVVANNSDEDPIGMGGEGKFDIPAVMVAKSVGDAIKAKLATEKVTVDLKPTERVEKPWMADTMSPFSSRGPRSEDGLIKPEISAPGSNIISADIGGGEKGVQMSGTSMAGPHIAGVMALLKQKFATANTAELKSVLMGHGKLIGDKDKKQYTVSRQGAGRVQVAESLETKIVTTPAALSFGITDLESSKTLTQELTIKNISAESLTLKPEWKGSASVQISVSEVTLAAGESKKVLVTAKINSAAMKETTEEMDGYLSFK
ncbi:MAG: S8 family serine peptidase, partial [Bdellovibrionaceae bacterium]|nr:S8 family serine peptidase [Pseudobdellovibrionaceae bacterium]